MLENKLRHSGITEEKAKEETELAKIELSKIQSRNDELEITNTQIDNLKQRNVYLEKKLLVRVKTETELKEKIIELDNRLKTYQNSVNLLKELYKSQVIGSKIAIEFYYSSKKKQVVNYEPVNSSSKDTPSFLRK